VTECAVVQREALRVHRIREPHVDADAVQICPVALDIVQPVGARVCREAHARPCAAQRERTDDCDDRHRIFFKK